MPYVAFVYDVPGRKDAVVEVALFHPSVIVSFLDDNRQRSTTYAFMSDGESGLFLDEMLLRTFGTDGLATRAESHAFSRDGLITITVSDFSKRKPGRDDSWEERSWNQRIGDFTPLFEPIPSFGDYDSITRYDR